MSPELHGMLHGARPALEESLCSREVICVRLSKGLEMCSGILDLLQLPVLLAQRLFDYLFVAVQWRLRKPTFSSKQALIAQRRPPKSAGVETSFTSFGITLKNKIS